MGNPLSAMRPSGPSVRILPPVALTVLVALGGASPLLPEQLSRFERERARMMLKIVKADIDKFYYDPAYRGIDLDSVFGAAGEKIDQAASIGQCFAAIARPLLELKDSHTFFLPPSRAARLEYGWRMQMIGDRCFITAVEDGSDAAAKGLKRGDAILAIDGLRPTRDNLWGILYVYRALAPRGTVRLQVQSPGGQAREVEVTAKVEQGKRFMQLTRSADFEDFIHEIQDRDYLGRHRLQILGEKLLIWKMPQFDLSPSEVKNNMRQVEEHEALILDLRGNGGGAVETLGALVGSFLDGDVKVGDVVSREPLKPIVAKAAGDAWQGKLVVLIDSQSGSAAELFARSMQIEKRAAVLGDRSSGSVMMSRLYDHGIGDSTRIFFATSVTVADIIMKDGKSLERTGVAPDAMILPSAEDLAAGRDPVLSRAASLCGVTLSPEKAGSLFPVEWKR